MFIGHAYTMKCHPNLFQYPLQPICQYRPIQSLIYYLSQICHIHVTTFYKLKSHQTFWGEIPNKVATTTFK
jgi:hypothetical protein